MQTPRHTSRRGSALIALASITMLSSVAVAADYYVDPNYAGVNGAPFGNYAGAYNSITAALAAGGVPSGASASNPNHIYIAPGTYNTAYDPAHGVNSGVSLQSTQSNIALIGLSGNPDDVVITSTLDAAYNTGSATIGTTGSSSLQIKGSNVSSYNITFANSTDTPYIVNVGHQAVSPQGNYATGQSQTSNSQCVALKVTGGDRTAFQNCKFLGYQDTLYVDNGRSYFKNCYVSGDIDFIFSKGTAVFRNSTINLDGDHPGGTVTAASTDKRTSNGIVFLDSTIQSVGVHGNPVIDPLNGANASGAPANNMWLGRPWGWTQAGGDASTVFINTKMAPAVRNAGWLNWDSTELNSPTKNNGDLTQDTRYAEFNSMDSGGNPLDVSQRVTWQHQLTAAQAAAYTVTNLFSVETDFPWFGFGYTGSTDPTNPNYSWPAYWGPRNTQNETNNATVSGNPSAYSDPQWVVAGSWDAEGQLTTAPEPGSTIVVGAGVFALSLLRRRR